MSNTGYPDNNRLIEHSSEDIYMSEQSWLPYAPFSLAHRTNTQAPSTPFLPRYTLVTPTHKTPSHPRQRPCNQDPSAPPPTAKGGPPALEQTPMTASISRCDRGLSPLFWWLSFCKRQGLPHFSSSPLTLPFCRPKHKKKSFNDTRPAVLVSCPPARQLTSRAL